MNLLLFIVQIAAVGLSFGFLGWCLGNGHGYDEGHQVGYDEGKSDAESGKRTFPARDELAIALLKADPEAYFRVTRGARP